MEAGHARIEEIEPRIAEAVGDPDLAGRGTQAIREVMAATEVDVASMLARLDADVARLIADADTSARTRVSDRRRQLAGARRELALWAAAVAQGFENVLGLLDEADARMAVPEISQAVPAASKTVPESVPAPATEAGAARPSRLRLAESPPAGAEDASAAGDGDEADAGEAEGAPRPRWWRRWFRQAA